MEHDARGLGGAFITEIYAALLGNGSWQSFLDRLSGVLPNCKPHLIFQDINSQTGALALTSQFEQDKIASYNQYYYSKNPYVPKVFTMPIGHGGRSEEILSREELFRTEFYSDYLRPQGLRAGVGVTIFRSDGCNFMLTLMSAAYSDDPLSESFHLCLPP